MTERWRGNGAERPERAWFRQRWDYGTVHVLDTDLIICDTAYHHGLIIELKHVDARDKSWVLTRRIAQGLGWWAALIEHDTQGVPQYRTLLPPEGPMHQRATFDPDKFDAWVSQQFGANRTQLQIIAPPTLVTSGQQPGV